MTATPSAQQYPAPPWRAHFCSLQNGHSGEHRCWCVTRVDKYSLPPYECEAPVVGCETRDQIAWGLAYIKARYGHVHAAQPRLPGDAPAEPIPPEADA